MAHLYVGNDYPAQIIHRPDCEILRSLHCWCSPHASLDAEYLPTYRLLSNSLLILYSTVASDAYSLASLPSARSFHGSSWLCNCDSKKRAYNSARPATSSTTRCLT